MLREVMPYLRWVPSQDQKRFLRLFLTSILWIDLWHVDDNSRKES